MILKTKQTPLPAVFINKDIQRGKFKKSVNPVVSFEGSY